MRVINENGLDHIEGGIRLPERGRAGYVLVAVALNYWYAKVGLDTVPWD